MSTNEFGVGQMHELAIRFDKAGFASGDVEALTVPELRKLRAVQLGLAEITHRPALVYCDEEPLTPEGLRVVHHDMQGNLYLNRASVTFRSCVGPVGPYGGYAPAESVAARIKHKAYTPFNANVLDFLLEHQHLVGRLFDLPYQARDIYFWGTRYIDDDGVEWVRGMGLSCHEPGWVAVQKRCTAYENRQNFSVWTQVYWFPSEYIAVRR